MEKPVRNARPRLRRSRPPHGAALHLQCSERPFNNIVDDVVITGSCVHGFASCNGHAAALVRAWFASCWTYSQCEFSIEPPLVAEESNTAKIDPHMQRSQAQKIEEQFQSSRSENQ